LQGLSVVPAQAGTQEAREGLAGQATARPLDARLRGHDGIEMRVMWSRNIFATPSLRAAGEAIQTAPAAWIAEALRASQGRY